MRRKRLILAVRQQARSGVLPCVTERARENNSSSSSMHVAGFVSRRRMRVGESERGHNDAFVIARPSSRSSSQIPWSGLIRVPASVSVCACVSGVHSIMLGRTVTYNMEQAT